MPRRQHTYYALFHCLAHSCADRLAGSSGSRLMWRRAYRALEHRQAKARCENVPSSFPDAIHEFGRAFTRLQRKRHLADYDPDYPVSKPDVVADVASVKAAIDGFLAVPRQVRRDFAIHVLTKVRADA